MAAPAASSGSGIAVGTASAAPARTVTAAPPQPVRPAPVLGAGVVLTGEDRNATVRLRVGQRVRVLLAGDEPLRWRPVRSSSPAVVDVVDAAGGYPAPTFRAGVVARSPGRAWLSTTTDAPCLHGRYLCLPAVRDWRVTVIVRP